MPLRIGEAAPPFEAEDALGERHRLDVLLERGPVVLFFYPRDRTPGCTRQACALRDVYAELRAAGASVLGVGGGDAASHRAFGKAHRLPFPLLLDPGARLARRYGATWFGSRLRRRVTYVLDCRGLVRARCLSELRPGRHAQLALQAVLRLQQEPAPPEPRPPQPR